MTDIRDNTRQAIEQAIYDNGAERMVCAGVIHDPTLLEIARGASLTPNHFVETRHAVIYELASVLTRSESGALSLPALYEAWSERDGKAVIDSGSWLVELHGEIKPRPEDFLACVRSVLERRCLIDSVVRLAGSISSICGKGLTPAEGVTFWDTGFVDVVRRAERDLEATRTLDHGGKSIAQQIREQAHALADEDARKDVVQIKTTLPTFDRELRGGMRPGELHAVGAAPGVGKTVHGTHVCVANAKRGVRSLFVSGEMSAKDITEQMMQQLAGVQVDVQSGEPLASHELDVLDRVAEDFDRLPLEVHDTMGAPASRVLSTIRAKVQLAETAGDPVRLVVFDYIQILGEIAESGARDERPHERISGFVVAMSALAKRYGFAGLLLSQLKDSDRHTKPSGSSLAGSSFIERHCVSIIGLWKPGDDEATAADAKAVLAKARRRGATEGRVILIKHDKRNMRPVELDLHAGMPGASGLDPFGGFEGGPNAF